MNLVVLVSEMVRWVGNNDLESIVHCPWESMSLMHNSSLRHRVVAKRDQRLAIQPSEKPSGEQLQRDKRDLVRKAKVLCPRDCLDLQHLYPLHSNNHRGKAFLEQPTLLHRKQILLDTAQARLYPNLDIGCQSRIEYNCLDLSLDYMIPESKGEDSCCQYRGSNFQTDMVQLYLPTRKSTQ
jgi:hypothetical protein